MTLHPLVPYEKMIINVALTGAIPTKEMSPYVPIHEEEIIQDAIECCKAGASIVHLHVRDELGNPDYQANRYAKIIKGIRTHCDIIICVSTSGRHVSSFENRAEVLSLRGIEKPDMASLTLGSFNFPKQTSINSPEMIFQLAELMLSNHIKPELEIFDIGMLNFAKYLDKKINLPKPHYFNFLMGSLSGIPAHIEDLAYLLRHLPNASYWSAAGMGLFQLPMNTAAIVAGGGVRTGIEDNIYFDFNKNTLSTNKQLVERIVQMANLYGREIATPNDARQILNLATQISDESTHVIPACF